jgi:hypothetical protein
MASAALKCTSQSYLTLALEAIRKAKLAGDSRTASDLESAAADYLKRAESKLKAEQGS